MNALVKKEIRLLLPAWITAMLLVFAPIPIGMMIEGDCATEVTAVRLAFAVGVASVILGLTGFGREVSSRTFSLLLAQPRSRRELWRAKIGVLMAALIPLGLFLVLVHQVFVPRPMVSSSIRQTIAMVWALTICATVTGGLWTTLLFRQLIAAFWISVVVPFAIFAAAMQPEDESTRGRLATVLLLAYSVAGYLFARWQFLRAQDTAWTGGDVTLRGIAKWLPWTCTATARKQSHPLLALLSKELQFQQINFLLGGVLLLVQIAVLIAQKLIKHEERTALQMMLEGFWGIWLVMPLLVGSSAVAEERKLGMMETQLCLPVSRGRQFAMKALVTLLCGTLLGAAVPVALALGHQMGPGEVDHGFLWGWPLSCALLALVAFYASTLTSQLLQAFGAAIGIIVAALLLGNWFTGTYSGAVRQFTILGLDLWRGPLALITGASVMLLAAIILSWRGLRWVWIFAFGVILLLLLQSKIRSLFDFTQAMNNELFGIRIGFLLALCPVVLTLALAARNANQSKTLLLLWWRNAAVWLGCLLLTGVITTLVYHRTWEIFMRFEPPAGAARLSGPVQSKIAAILPNRPILILFPDGRLGTFRGFEHLATTKPDLIPGDQDEPYWQVVQHPRVEFVTGSNWVSLATSKTEAAAVRSDGSLWRAEFFEWVDGKRNPVSQDLPPEKGKGFSKRPRQIKFERFGDTTNWKTISASWNHFAILKRDGTIWGWGAKENGQLGEAAKFSTNAPAQIGTASDWVAAFASPGCTFAVNRAGEIWKWGQFATDIWGKNIEKGPVKLNLKVSGVRAIASNNNFDLILDAEGKLWGFGRIQRDLAAGAPANELYAKAIQQPGENWSALSLSWEGLVLLKNDGTAWSRTWEHDRGQPAERLAQVGRRNDWIAITKEFDAVLALAKDGTVCRFGEAYPSEGRLLAPTRRVTWSLNLLKAAK